MRATARWTAEELAGAKRIAALRRKGVRELSLGTVVLGGRAPISIQSMTTTPTEDIDATLAQVAALEEVGCQVVRLAVPTRRAARALRRIKEQTVVPLVADVHFNFRLALDAIEAGVDGLRLNPGNIGSPDRVRQVARAAEAAGVPIRIGVNGGSLEEDIKRHHGGPTDEALVESALKHIMVLEEEGFHDIIVSLKSSSVPTTLAACRRLAKVRSYAQHVGITEAGIGPEAVAKSFLGIGLLLLEGIGETIRISLTGDPIREVRAARRLLGVLGRLTPGVSDGPQ